MKTLKVPYICTSVADASAIPALFSDNHIEYQRIESLNWADAYPYLPDVRFAISHCPSGLLIHFKVNEQSVRAVAEADFDRVWEDSCVEFFSSPEDDGLYYNIECTCAGRLWIAVGSGREGREFAPETVMTGVKRWTSLGTDAFGIVDRPTAWEAALVIPLSTYFKHDVKSLSGRIVRANVYTCGDKLPVPHFVSWNPIETEKPDYHRPEFFGELEF